MPTVDELLAESKRLVPEQPEQPVVASASPTVEELLAESAKLVPPMPEQTVSVAGQNQLKDQLQVKPSLVKTAPQLPVPGFAPQQMLTPQTGDIVPTPGFQPTQQDRPATFKELMRYGVDTAISLKPEHILTKLGETAGILPQGTSEAMQRPYKKAAEEFIPAKLYESQLPAPTTTSGKIADVGSQLTGELASWLVPATAATKLLKIPKYVGWITNFAKTAPKTAKYIDDAVKSVVTFNIHNQAYTGTDTSLKDRAISVIPTTIDALLFSTISQGKQLLGKAGKYITPFAWFGYGAGSQDLQSLLTTGKASGATGTDRLVGGAVMTFLGFLMSGGSRVDAQRAVREALADVKTPPKLADEITKEITTKLPYSPTELKAMQREQATRSAQVVEEALAKPNEPIPADREAQYPVKSKPKTYDEAQARIDEIETNLEKQGVDVVKLYDPTVPGSEILKGYEGRRPMPPELIEAYKVRDAIGSGEMTESIGGIKSKIQSSGITDETEIREILSYYGLKEGETDAVSQAIASQHTINIASMPLQKQVEGVAISLAINRGERIDSVADISKKTLRDAALAVKGVLEFFGLKGSTPSRLSLPLSPASEPVKISPETRPTAEATEPTVKTAPTPEPAGESISKPPEGTHEIRTVTRTADEGAYVENAKKARETGTAYKQNKSIEEINANLDRLTDDQLLLKLQDKTDADRGLAGVLLMQRRQAAGQPTQPIYDMLIKDFSDIGFLLRSAAEIKGATADGIVDIAAKASERFRAPLTEGQKNTIRGAANADIAARKVLKQAQKNYLDNPTFENDAALTNAQLAAERASNKLLTIVGNFQPKSVAKTLFKIMQLNLLGPMSHMYNLSGNLINQPIRGLWQYIAAGIDALRSKLTGGKREIVMPNVKAWGKGMVEGTKRIPELMKKGGAIQQQSVAGEITQPMKPAQSWARILHPSRIPENIKGMQRVSNYIVDVLEGTFGIPAEVNARLLAAFDAPAFQGGYRQALREIGIAKGLKGKDLDTFSRLPFRETDEGARVVSRSAMQEAIKRAKESVYQGDNGFTRTMTSLANIGNKWPWLNTALRVLSGNMFVKTPSNIINEGAQTLIPPISIARGLLMMKSGNVREAEISFARALVGAVIWSTGAALAKLGIVTPSPATNRAEQGLEQESVPPKRINISALSRLMKGQDPNVKTGDTTIQLAGLGFLGLGLGMAADGYDRLERQAAREHLAYSPETASTIEAYSSSLLSSGKTLLNNLAMLKGQQIILDALASQRYEKWTENVWQLMTSIPMPATLKAIGAYRNPYIPETDSVDFWTKLTNQFKQKGGIKTDIPKRNIWGEPIPSTPPGSTAFTYHFFDFNKTRDIPGRPESMLLYDVNREAVGQDEKSAVVPSLLSRDFTIKGNILPTKLTDEQYDKFEELVGKYRLEFVGKILKQHPNITTMSVYQKTRMIKQALSEGRDKGEMELFKLYPELRTRK